MNTGIYNVILTNGNVENEYLIDGVNQQEAMILAQAEAIKLGRGYKFVRIE